MGLDVYLYKYEDFKDTKSREDQYEKQSEENWDRFPEYDAMTEDQKNQARDKDKQIAKALNLKEYGSDDDNKQCVEMDSKTDPDHYFKLGYFRSSYNGGGINRVLENVGISNLYRIFEPSEEYVFKPDWESALLKTKESIELLEKEELLSCFKVSANSFGPKYTKSKKDAIQKTKQTLSKDSSFEQGFSNIDGEFFPKGFEVVALLPGKNNFIGREEHCTYIVYKNDKEWYITALKIVKETIEYVLSQKDKDKYYLHWSS